MKIRYVCLTSGQKRAKNINAMKEQIPELEVFNDINKEKFEFLLTIWDNIKNDNVIWLEDDVTLCNNFKKIIENEIDFLGYNELISFFYSPLAGLHDNEFFSKDSRSSYRDGKAFLWNQCVFIPKGFSNYFIDFYNKTFKNFSFFDPQKFNYDNCIAHSLNEIKQKYWLIRPSLVQHDDKNSILGHSDNRVSLFFDYNRPYEKGYHFEYISVKLLIARLPKQKKNTKIIDSYIREIEKCTYINFNNIDYNMLYALNKSNIKYVYVRCKCKDDLIFLSKL